MITLPKYHGETAVFGLGRSGLSVVRALAAAGNRVSAWDQNDDQRAEAEKAGAQIRDLETEVGAPARLVLSPGVPLTHPQPHAVVKAARAADVPGLGDVELFADAVGYGGTPKLLRSPARMANPQPARSSRIFWRPAGLRCGSAEISAMQCWTLICRARRTDCLCVGAFFLSN